MEIITYCALVAKQTCSDKFHGKERKELQQIIVIIFCSYCVLSVPSDIYAQYPIW